MSGFGKRNRPHSAGVGESVPPLGALPPGDTWRGPEPSFRPSIIDIRSIRTGGRSMLVAYLWWAVFGHLGAHRFYVGKAGSGLAMASVHFAGLVLTLIYFVGLVVLIPFYLFVLIDAFRIPGWVRGY
jgi:TM2 domain-containing membrane protein YozV